MRKYLLKQKIHKCYLKEIFTLKRYNQTHGQTAGSDGDFLNTKFIISQNKIFSKPYASYFFGIINFIHINQIIILFIYVIFVFFTSLFFFVPQNLLFISLHC
jgi:hypothetical protein